MKLLLRSILVILALTSFERIAFADTFVWANSGTTNFNTSTNWVTATGGGVPGAGDNALVGPGFSFITGTGTVVIQDGGNSDVTITSTTNQSLANFDTSSDLTDSTGAVHSISDGVLNMTFNSGSANTTLTLSGADGFAVLGSDTMNFAGNLVVSGGHLAVGSNNSLFTYGEPTGPGTLNILNASNVNLDGGSAEFIVGDGVSGTVTQANSTLTTGQNSIIGANTGNGSGGVGLYTLTGGSFLNIGNQTSPRFGSYNFQIGGGTNSTGTLNLTNSTLNAANPNTTIELGSATGATGTIVQSGASSSINLSNGNLLLIGNSDGATGTYNLETGALNIDVSSEVAIGEVAGSTGTLTQTGGTITEDGTSFFVVGDAGTGTYSISAGSADFQDGLALANSGSATGIVLQSGTSTVTAEGLVIIGNGGAGTYTLSGGSATFSDGVIVGDNSNFNLTGGTFSLGGNPVNVTVEDGGTVTQTAGTVTINNATLGQKLDLSAANSTYNLNGGILAIDNGGFAGSGGNLNFGGGTLQATGSGSFTDPYAGSLAVNTVSTIDGSNGTITSVRMAGALGGNGGIEFIGSSVNTAFSFGSANSYTGATILQTGTLTANLNQIGSSDLINLVNANSTLDFSTSNTGLNQLQAALDGSGTLNVSFTHSGDTLELANPTASTFSGAINLGTNGTGSNGFAGTLQIFNGTFGAITDPFATGSGVTIGGDSSVTNTGSVKFTQVETYTGLTTVNSGFTLLAPGVGGSVMNNGTLGTLGTLAAPATMTIGGNLTSTGTLLVHINPTTADLFNVLGTAAPHSSLSGTIDVIGAGSETKIIVQTAAPGDLSSTATVNPPTPLFSSQLVLVNNQDLELVTTQNTLGSYAQTPNQQSVAGVLDPIISSGNYPTQFIPVLTALNGLPASEIPQALESLTPETLQYSRIIAFEGTTFLVQRMNGVEGDLHSGLGGLDTNAISVAAPGFDSGLGRQLTSLLASNSPSFHQAAPNGVNYYPEGGSSTNSTPGTISVPESSPAPGWEPSSQVISDTPNPYLANQHSGGPFAPGFSEFISGDVVLADLNNDQGEANAPSTKAKYTAEDATGGISYRFTSNFTAGVLFDYDHTDAETDGHNSKTQVDTYQPGLYATYFNKGFYVNGLFAFGYNEYSQTRNIGFLGQDAISNPNGEQYTGDIDFGYDFHPNKNWIVGPTLGVTYTHLDIDGFTETGASYADLSVHSQSADSVRSRLGGHVVFQTDTGPVLLQPNISVQWQHEYLDGVSPITSTFSGSNPFTIETVAPSRDSALIGVGLTATLSSSISLTLNYMADVGADNYFAQSILGGFRAQF